MTFVYGILIHWRLGGLIGKEEFPQYEEDI
jgi:hypothetical protein